MHDGSAAEVASRRTIRNPAASLSTFFFCKGHTSVDCVLHSIWAVFTATPSYEAPEDYAANSLKRARVISEVLPHMTYHWTSFRRDRSQHLICVF